MEGNSQTIQANAIDVSPTWLRLVFLESAVLLMDLETGGAPWGPHCDRAARVRDGFQAVEILLLRFGAPFNAVCCLRRRRSGLEPG